MTRKTYDWKSGATLEEHSRRKHKILREYHFQYIVVRCRLPQMTRFRLAIIDGFAGGGRYGDGTAGSPVIFIEEISRAVCAVNVERAAQGMAPLDVECLLVLNDVDKDAIEELKKAIAPTLEEARSSTARLHIQVEYLNVSFEQAYPTIKELLGRGHYRNALFNLDQCGHSHVDRLTLVDIMRSYPRAEIFYTFAIGALIAFLQKSEPTAFAAQLRHLHLSAQELVELQGANNNNTWLGIAERIVFEVFRQCAPFNSPFSINNPDGWKYWLIHFSNSYRARQVYNNILHLSGGTQAHFGRSGLNMLSYNPRDDGTLYLFDDPGRERAAQQLFEDIPRVVEESGDVMTIGEFYESVYNTTPAHTDDIHKAIILNPDLQVVTELGGERRKANTISVTDILRLKRQRSFFPTFLGRSKSP